MEGHSGWCLESVHWNVDTGLKFIFSLPRWQEIFLRLFFLGMSVSLLPIMIFPCREIDMGRPSVDSMRRFNHLHAKMRVAVENCFNRLKGQWRLLRMICTHPEMAACVQEVCVALLTFVEARDVAYKGEDGEFFNDGSMADVEWTASDQLEYAAGRARRVEIVKPLGLLSVDDQ